MDDGETMYEAGVVAWHSSDEDGGGPDVGISVGLGGMMLYAGEAPGLKGPWSLVLYPTSGDRIVIAETVEQEAARDMIDMLGARNTRGTPCPTPVPQIGRDSDETP